MWSQESGEKKSTGNKDIASFLWGRVSSPRLCFDLVDPGKDHRLGKEGIRSGELTVGDIQAWTRLTYSKQMMTRYSDTAIR